MSEDQIALAEERLGHRFTDRTLLRRALRHSSGADRRLESNERLEFLGDAVLAMVVCDDLYQRFPEHLEGELTKLKSNVVSRRCCAEMADELGLMDLLEIGKGMGGRHDLPRSLSAAVFESVIGALYLDAGLEHARNFILRQIEPRIELAARLGHQQNFKSVLQQSLQQLGAPGPNYNVIDERGPDHAKCFCIAVGVARRRFAACWGTSKKQAEQQAALAALIQLELAAIDDDGLVQVRELAEVEVDAFWIGVSTAEAVAAPDADLDADVPLGDLDEDDVSERGPVAAAGDDVAVRATDAGQEHAAE